MESSRSINHKLNELLSKNSSKSKLSDEASLQYGSILKSNILGKDKQEKVNSIVVLAKLLDCIGNSNDEFHSLLDHELFETLYSIISPNMSTETYKAILKISVVLMSGSIFQNPSIDFYSPLLDSLIEYLDVIDIITTKLFLQDGKITLNSIKLIYHLINRALEYKYTGIITLAGRLKHVTFFSTIGNLLETDDKLILESIEELKVSYYNLNMYLDATKFDLSIKSHQVMLNNLFIFLETSLNEYGTPATIDEYVKAGFTENPRQFVIEKFTLLLAMDLKIFLKDPNFTFKKRFHEELMMSDHERTFPLYLFIDKATQMWIDIFSKKQEYPYIFSSILSWELMIYCTMNNSLVLWHETKAQLNNEDIDKIVQLLYSNLNSIEFGLSCDKSIEECLELDNNMRKVQVENISLELQNKWKSQFLDFDKNLQVQGLIIEQRLSQLLKGVFVYTSQYGEFLFKNIKPPQYKYYYILLSPNRNFLYYKEFKEKITPTLEEMEENKIKISQIAHVTSTKIGSAVGEHDTKKNSMLISIKGTISYERISLLDANSNVILSFYTESASKKSVIEDGIKMLKQLEPLSEETLSQIEKLTTIRKLTQMLNIESMTPETEEDEDWELDELNSVANNFSYN